MLRSGKKITAVVLSAVMRLPCFAAGVSASGAEITGADVSGTGVQITSTMESTGSSSVGQYSLDQVNTSLLVTHTGKSSEVSNPDIAALGSLMTDASVYEENMITLSCDSGLYDALGFSSQGLIRPHTAVRQGRQGQQRRRRARCVGLAARHGIKPLDAQRQLRLRSHPLRLEQGLPAARGRRLQRRQQGGSGVLLPG